MFYEKKKALLAKVPRDWERVADRLIEMAGEGGLRKVKYDSENFGNCIIVLRYRFVSIKLIKDRNDEWVDLKSSLGCRWVTLSELVGIKPASHSQPISMFDSISYLENEVFNWPKKKWYIVSLKLLVNKNMRGLLK